VIYLCWCLGIGAVFLAVRPIAIQWVLCLARPSAIGPHFLARRVFVDKDSEQEED
jgi:hypothetical protein